MPNGNYINKELDFERHISNMPDRALLEYVARQNYETCIRCEQHNQRITILENQSKKTSGLIGGIAGLMAAIAAGIINYLFIGR